MTTCEGKNVRSNSLTLGRNSALALGLRVARGASGLTEIELARRARVGINTIRRSERGLMIPREPQLRRIAEVLAGADDAE